MYRSLAVIAIILLAAGCGTAQQGASSSSPSSGSSSSARPSGSTPAEMGPMSFDDVNPGSSLRAGTYVLRYATIGGRDSYPTLSFEFMVGAGWEKVGIEGALWNDNGTHLGFGVPTNVYADPCEAEQGLLDPSVATSIDQLTGALLDLPGWRAGPFEWDRYAGFMGTHVSLTAPTDLSGCDEPARTVQVPGFPGFIEGAGEGDQLDLWILNAEGTLVVLYTNTPRDASAAERAELQAVFDSIRITP